MNAFALYEGSYSVDISKKFIPFDETKDDPRDRPASLFVHIQPFLIKTKNDLVLLDTGLGYRLPNGMLHIHANLNALGIEPGEVTKVLMSHLHFDHAGGMVSGQNGKKELNFPEADYYIQRGEWENAFSKPSKSYQTSQLEYMQRSGHLILLEGDQQINPEVRCEVTGGHTEFHQVFYIHSGEEVYFFGGDVVPEASQVLRKFVAKYDFDGRKSAELRQEFGKKAIAENWICLMYHDKKNAIVRFKMEDEMISVEKI